MTNQGLARIALYVLDRLTDAFPTVVPSVVHGLFLGAIGNPLTYRWYQETHRRGLRGRSFGTILIVADSGIGDAINLQHAARLFRRKYPHARIDYLCSRAGGELVQGVPAIDHVFPVSTTNGRLAEGDRRRIQEVLGRAPYDLIVNLCPFIPREVWPKRAHVLDLYVPFAAHLLRLWKLDQGGMSIPTALQHFLEHFLALAAPNQCATLDRTAESNAVFLSDDVMQRAQEVLTERRLLPGERLVFYNPDSSSPYTLIPLELQIALVRGLAQSEEIEAVLLGTGQVCKGIEARILAALPPDARAKVVLAPTLSLPAYAALLDSCDAFVSGDGGPLHIAASRKVSVTGSFAPRNRTAVVAIFGATDSRMYGYDSERPDHAPSAQDAPSRTFRGGPPCRNVTCVNKLGKTCRDIRCFQGIEAAEITTYVRAYFRSLGRMRETA